MTSLAMSGASLPADAGRRFFIVAAIAAALMIPLFIINSLVWERSSTADQVRREITAGWAGSQVLRGPWLVVPFTETTVGTEVVAGVAREVIGRRRDALMIAPDDLRVDATLTPDKRRRSLFEVIVYGADVAVDATFSLATLRQANVDGATLDWDRAYLTLGVGDPKGFGGAIPRFRIDGRTIDAEPGSRDLSLPGGALNAAAGLAAAPEDGMRLSARLTLKGSTSFAVSGHARRLIATVASPWPNPSFTGGILPDSRRVSDAGFSARWSTTYLALNRPLSTRASQFEKAAPGAQPAAGVALIEPVELYAQVGRAVKYGALFIALTFLTFFVFDMTGRRRVPALAYALVGLGLALFYLLLLALAEYISLTPAYAAAAAALVALVTSYSRAVLGGSGRAAVIAVVLSLLYGFLYVLLQLHDFALLLGSVALFAALAVLMYVTRNIDGEPVPAAA